MLLVGMGSVWIFQLKFSEIILYNLFYFNALKKDELPGLIMNSCPGGGTRTVYLPGLPRDNSSGKDTILQR